MAAQSVFDPHPYDEDEALTFIRQRLPEDANTKLDDDDVLCVVDLIWDYYDSKGMLSLENFDDEEELLDTAELIKFVKKEVAADEELNIPSKIIEVIIKAELDYEKSLEENL